MQAGCGEETGSNKGQFTCQISSFQFGVFGSEVTEDESDLFCHPSRSRHGGIGIRDPVKAAHICIHYSRLKEATRCLSESIYDGSRLDLNMHDHTIRTALKKKEEDEKQKKIQ